MSTSHVILSLIRKEKLKIIKNLTFKKMSTRIFLLLALTLIVTVSSFKMNTFTKNSGKIIENLRKNSRFN